VKRIFLLVVCLAAVVAVAGCGDNDKGAKTKDVPPTVSDTSDDETPPEEPPTAPSDGDAGDVSRGAPTYAVTVENGFPVGGPKTWTVEKGDAVKLVVDGAPGEVHLHGYDIAVDPNGNGRAVIELDTADVQGSFELELEDSGTLVATLVVE
jgi:hypothetical protein